MNLKRVASTSARRTVEDKGKLVILLNNALRHNDGDKPLAPQMLNDGTKSVTDHLHSNWTSVMGPTADMDAAEEKILYHCQKTHSDFKVAQPVA